MKLGENNLGLISHSRILAFCQVIHQDCHAARQKDKMQGSRSLHVFKFKCIKNCTILLYYNYWNFFWNSQNIVDLISSNPELYSPGGTVTPKSLTERLGSFAVSSQKCIFHQDTGTLCELKSDNSSPPQKKKMNFEYITKLSKIV